MKLPKKILVPVGVAVVVVFAIYVFRWLSEEDRGEFIKVSGNLELTEVQIAFKVPGKLAELRVSEGDFVRKGTLVARLDQEEWLRRKQNAQAALDSARSRLLQLEAAIEFQREQLQGQSARSQAELKQAEIGLKELQSGSRQQEIQMARAAVRRSEADFERAQKDWNRAQTLYEQEDISTAQYDDFRARFEASQASLNQTKEQLELVVEGPRREDIEAGKTQVERAKANLRLAEAVRLELKRLQAEKLTRAAEIRQAEAQLAIVEAQLNDTEATAPMDGVVLVKVVEPGEVVAAGTTIVTLGNLSKPWLRAYIAEEDLGKVRLGAKAQLTTDSFPNRSYPGRVSFISSEAEFTPKQIQTQEERVKLVYRIKIEVDNPDGELKSNMPADARIPVSGT